MPCCCKLCKLIATVHYTGVQISDNTSSVESKGKHWQEARANTAPGQPSSLTLPSPFSHGSSASSVPVLLDSVELPLPLLLLLLTHEPCCCLCCRCTCSAYLCTARKLFTTSELILFCINPTGNQGCGLTNRLYCS